MESSAARAAATAGLFVALLLLPYATAGSVTNRVGMKEPPGSKGEVQPCAGGMAGPYPCSHVDLLARIPVEAMGGSRATDLWGWTDPQSGREYALVGRANGTAFVDVTEPDRPRYLGNLPTARDDTIRRDIKVYADYAFIVADVSSAHGMQVFDLTRLRDVLAPPLTFEADARYEGFKYAHNIAINEESGFAYAVGSDTCNGGLHMIDIRVPTTPRGAGCFAADGYTHDAQCVIYRGPDEAFQGRELCFSANVDSLTLVDVTEKNAPAIVSRESYPGNAYAHQGWLTEDHRYFLLDDEQDETEFGHNTRTYIWEMSDLTAPRLLGAYTGPSPAIDHNLYVRGRYVYQANYTSGLRILELDGISQGILRERAFFDVYPESDSVAFRGAWSVYPFFESGTLIVSSIEGGLFVLRATLPSPDGGYRMAFPLTLHADDVPATAEGGRMPEPAND